MKTAGGVIGVIAGIFGFIAAIITLFVGGVGAALDSDGASTVVGFGWGGVLFSFLVIIAGAVAFSKPRGAGIALIVFSILGIVLGGTFVAICMGLSFCAGVLALMGSKTQQNRLTVGPQ